MAIAVSRSEKRYRMLITATAAIVWVSTPEGKILEANGLEAFTGRTIEGDILAFWISLIHPDDRPEVSASWDRISRNERSWDCVYRLLAADGRYHHVHSRGAAVINADGGVEEWIGTVNDIHQRIEAEESQRRAYAELAEARSALNLHADNLENEVRLRTARLEEVNAELEAFTYSASHDLRVPLRHIHGFAETILADSGETLSADTQANLRVILSSARRMDMLIHDLLAYSRLSRDEITLAPFSLDTVVADVIADHRATIENQHAEITVHSPLPTVMADNVGLQQVLANLVSNALKFVATDVAPRVNIRAETRDGRVRLWIEDNGIGIEPRYHEDIFVLFRRLHGAKRYAGTGIGLSLVRKGMTRMGGECGVASSPGEGSRFWLDFQPVPIG